MGGKIDGSKGLSEDGNDKGGRRKRERVKKGRRGK